MDYISVSQAAEKWGVSERSIRNYCRQGRIVGAVLNGHSWLIPESAAKQESLLALNPGSFYRSAKRYTSGGKIWKSYQTDTKK